MLPTLLTSILSGEATFAVRRARTAIVVYGLIGLCVLLALGFLLAAGFIYTSRIYGSLNAASGFAGGFLLLGLAIWIAFRISSSVRTKRRARRQRGELASLAAAAGIAALPGLIKGRSIVTLVGLPLAALVAAQIYRENTRRADPGPTDPED